MSTARARQFRRQMPAGEAWIWNLLRQPPFKDFHFRRQVPFAAYYADFASHSAKLIIEIDGVQHTTDEAETYDARRTAFLDSRGYRVIRFSNADVLNNIAAVYAALLEALNVSMGASGAPPTASGGPPSRHGGGSAD